MCFYGSMHHRNLPYISGPVDEGKCPTAGAAGNIFSFCEAALKISGPVPIRQQLGRELGPGTLATAVTATSVGDNTVAIVGTQAGTVIKVLLADGEATVVDSFVAAEGEPVLAGTRMHPNNVELLVLTPTRLRRLKIADCGQLGFCGECLSKRDPFCGWCSLQNECTLQDDCSDLTSSRRSSAAASKWLPLGAKIEPGKLVRGLAGVRSTKLQETVFTTFCRRPAGPRLDHLCLSHNDLSQLSPQLFVEVCKHVKCLEIFNSKVTKAQMEGLFEAVSSKSLLRELNVNYNDLSQVSSATMARGLNNLHKVFMYKTELTEGQVEAILDYGMRESRLYHLDIRYNIRANSSCHLTKYLRSHVYKIEL